MLIQVEDVAMHALVEQRLAEAPMQFGGHEFSGVVSQVGAEVRGLEIGHRDRG